MYVPIWVVPRNSAARLVCGGPGRAVTPSKRSPDPCRPGYGLVSDVTRPGVSAEPEVWVKAVEAVRPVPSYPSNTAEDGKCPSSLFDNCGIFIRGIAQRPILAINWSFIGESAMVRAGRRARQSAVVNE